TGLTVSSTGCVSTFVIIDTVIPNRIFDFYLDSSITNNKAVQCFYKADGSNNKFNFLPDLPGNSLVGLKTILNWDFGDGTGTSQTSGEKSYTEPGNYLVELKLSSTIIYDEYCVDSVTHLMVVKPSPLDSTNVVFSDTSLCENGNLFEFSYTSSDPTISRNWKFGDGDSLPGSPVFHSYAAPGRYQVELEVTDSAGCYGEFSDSVEVVAQPNNFYTGLDSNYCEGDNPVLLTPNIATGSFEGDEIDNTTQLFSPITVGRNTISYIVQEGNCKDTFTRSTTVHPLPQFTLGNDTSICFGTQLDIKVDKGNAAMLWSTGASDSFTTQSTAGILWAQKTENGCSYRDSMNITVIDAPVVSLGNDSLLCGGGTVSVDVSVAEGIYTWNDGYVGGTRIISTTGYYQVTVTNKCGTASDDVDLEFLPFACDIFIPNAFSPNGDNHNNVFRPVGNVVLKKMEIYNRWGELLYEQDGNSLSWDGYYDGERVQTGQYYYVIYYLFPESNISVPKVASGAVYVVY
ncbi:MAG: gliding motility-associated C-terminal domain-containing protein, partial [Bacteroidia bacterium]|nr:gliding motility-associated C-terminal domain-containing protein [Bacteroidia bacterium]